MLDNKLRQFATDRQWEILETIESEGSERKAAKKLGLSKGTVGNLKAAVLRKAAKQGYSPEHGLTNIIPGGYKLKGSSTLYNKRTGESVLQWIKTSEDQARQEIFFRQTIEALSESLPRFEPVAPPEQTEAHLAAVYPIGDAHIGMYSWMPETGGDYDLSIAQNIHMGATDYLINSTPNCNKALIAVLGDFCHYDSTIAVTPHGKNNLDADGRYSKMINVAVLTIRYIIDKALSKHSEVDVIIAPGNHDPYSTDWLIKCLSIAYEKDQRVFIDKEPGCFKYWQFGKNLLGVYHGDKVKMDKLPGIMAADKSMEWGASEHREWLTGHTHSEIIREYPGCRCESFGILPPADAFCHGIGKRDKRTMKAIILHREHGEVARYTTSPQMLQ